MKFQMGRLVATPGVLEAVSRSDIDIGLERHLQGDWGDLSAEDKRSNDLALKRGERLLSAYHSFWNVKFWIITEADRSATTVLLPEEY